MGEQEKSAEKPRSSVETVVLPKTSTDTYEETSAFESKAEQRKTPTLPVRKAPLEPLQRTSTSEASISNKSAVNRYASMIAKQRAHAAQQNPDQGNTEETSKKQDPAIYGLVQQRLRL